MVKVMRKLRIVTSIFVMLILTLALAKSTVAAQTPEEMETFFSSEYAGISIQLNATQETVPGANMTINLWINCTADGVYVNYFNLSIYGYKHFRYGLEKLELLLTSPIKEQSLVYHNASQCNYTILVPTDVWDLTYAELHLKYAIKTSPYEYEETFPITTVRNVLWEELEQELTSLNETYLQLNSTYWQLNATFEQLNQTYWELQQNYTALKGSVNELGNTRTAVAALAITTVFFVATTLYMVIRKPKQYW
jgi:hypothetical protein